jgi:hypothetical protein
MPGSLGGGEQDNRFQGLIQGPVIPGKSPSFEGLFFVLSDFLKADARRAGFRHSRPSVTESFPGQKA